jgi:spore germination protein GerM
VTGTGWRSNVASRAVVVVALALMLTGLGACGIPTDDNPRLLAEQPKSDEPEPVDVASGDVAVLYFSSPGSETLVAVERGLEAEPNIQGALEQLLLGPIPEGEEEGLISSIPVDTTLVDHGISPDGLLTIDLSDQWAGLQAPGDTTAYAQVVLTATEFDEVRSVRFMVNGELVPDVPTGSPSGAAGSVVTRANYSALDPG